MKKIVSTTIRYKLFLIITKKDPMGKGKQSNKIFLLSMSSILIFAYKTGEALSIFEMLK